MDQLACVDVFELPLQILLRRRPDWAALPVVVVDEDRPQGTLLWANEAARQGGVLPGQRYATALSICRELRASVVPPGLVGAVVADLVQRLRQFTPNVEPSVDEPGVFWLDASGLGRLYPDLEAWSRTVSDALAEHLGLRCAIAVGATRFGTYAVARAAPGVITTFATREAERAACGVVPLARLGVPPRVRERLARLGVRTVGELIALPASGLRKRYGQAAYDLHRLANGDLFAPLRPEPERAPPRAREVFEDFLERDAHRLLFRIKRLLDRIVPIVRERQAVIAELRLVLTLDNKGAEELREPHRFRPAAPTLDTALLLDLVRLRLEQVDLAPGVSELCLDAREVPADADQLRLFALAPRRDIDAASRALARCRAELGERAVGVYALRSGHLPKARFTFVPGADLRAPSPPPADVDAERPPKPALVRRLHPRPLPLPARPVSLRNDGWQPRDPVQGAIVAVHGPYILSGGWWRAELHREYVFARTLRGDVLWVFYDRRRRRWYEQGRVE